MCERVRERESVCIPAAAPSIERALIVAETVCVCVCVCVCVSCEREGEREGKRG